MLSVLLLTASTGLVPTALPSQRDAPVSQRSAVSMMAGAIKNKMVWVDFAKSSDVQPGDIVSGFRYGQEIAIANEKGGGVYALSNKLPPTGQPATFGELAGKGVITEPITKTQFSLKTGKPLGTWCPSPVGRLFSLLVGPQSVPVYPVRKAGNKIQVLINVNAKAQFEANYWRGILDAQ